LLTKKEIKVLELRQQKLTQTEVAKKLDISQAAVSKFEKNAISKIRHALRTLEIAKKMKLEVEEDEDF
jgi:transcriptional regulator